jgi:prepilin-type N-terminal cleavage/methylation domain-containing protein
MRKMSGPKGQSGFSLVEMIIAMAVTLVVTGAVYGIMSGGNTAFRREPELTDRQQNARVAMDMIQRDIANAGTNLGPLFQTFTQGLNGANAAVVGPTGLNADHLEVFGNDGTCPDAPTRLGDPTNGVNVVAAGPIPSCYSEDALVVVLYSNGGAKWGVGHEIHAQNKMINFPGGLNGPDTGSQIQGHGELAEWVPGDGSRPVAHSPLNLVRYEIGYDPPGVPAPAGVPSLYRSPTGGRDPSNGAVYLPPTSAANVTNGKWQLLARGVEDLQVQYRNGTGAWADDPGAVVCAGTCLTPTTAEYNKGVREVRVTMSVRAEGYNLQGQTTGQATGRANAVRGNVTTVTSVKALQNYLSEIPATAACPQCPLWR